MAKRAAALERMLASRPHDPRLRFGLAIEYLKAGHVEKGVDALRSYLAAADDEGNAWGRLGHALQQLGRAEESRDAFRNGMLAAERHGHASLREELRVALEDLG